MTKSQKPKTPSASLRAGNPKNPFGLAQGGQLQMPRVPLIVRLVFAFLFLAACSLLFVWKNQKTVFVPKRSLPANILLLGYGGEGHDGANLTDTMMVAHLNTASKSAVLISVPRDIWYPSTGSGSKINAIFEKSPQAAMDAVEKVTGLTIDKYLAVDFAGFTQAIDLLGGVDVKVETTFDDLEYPVAGKENDPCLPCRLESLHFEAGMTHMDGQTALKFVRSRHSAVDGTDFGRSGRQRNVLMAVRDKVLNLNIIPQLPALYANLRDHVQTNFTMDDLRYFLPKIGELLNYKIVGVALTDENVLQYGWSDDGQMILMPKTGPVSPRRSEAEDWEEVKKYILSFIAHSQ